MNETQLKALEIFYPFYLKKREEVQRKNLKFVQYTSAEAAMNIIKNNEVWLRNCLCMNDFLEVEYGLNCFIEAYRSDTHGSTFKKTLESIFPGMIKKFEHYFDSWLPSFKSNTYIACVSEHLPEENHYGRLSMWRAYGGNRAVAVVMNKTPFLTETDVFHAYTNPVFYRDLEDFQYDFGEIAERFEAEKEFLIELGEEIVFNFLFEFFKNIALCIKHPGFKEEREWRLVYNPNLRKSKYVETGIEVIDGIPQEVHKIPLIDIPEEKFYGATIPNLIHRIIIGPSDHQTILRQTFVQLLTDAGCENAIDKVTSSGIPLR